MVTGDAGSRQPELGDNPRIPKSGGRARVVVEAQDGERVEIDVPGSHSAPRRSRFVDARRPGVRLLQKTVATFREAGPFPHPRALPVFVSNRSISIDDAMEVCASALDPDSSESLFWIRAAPRPWIMPPPPRLPFSIVLTVRATEKVGKIPQHRWLDRARQSLGIEIQDPFPADHPPAVYALLSETPISVVVALGEEIPNLIGAIEEARRASPSSRRPSDGPRVLVALHAEDERERLQEPRSAFARSVACVHVRGPEATWGRWIEGFAAGIAHDLPVHDAARLAWDRFAGPSATPMSLLTVVGDPGSIHGLRLADAIDELIDDADALSPFTSATRDESTSGGDQSPPEEAEGGEEEEVDVAMEVPPSDVRSPAGRPPGSEEAAPPPSWVGSCYRLIDRAQAGRHLTNIKGSAYESDALVPATGWARHVTDLNNMRASVAHGRMEKRSVDLCFRLPVGPALAARSVPDALEDFRVPRARPLEVGGRYRLCFRVGQPFVGSLFVSPPPPIDPLLKAIDSFSVHRVDVVVFPLDFIAEGAVVRSLVIPAFGSSATLSFPVRAPTKAGSARLRVAVFLGNHLVQSYLVRTTVARAGARSARGELSAELEFTRAEDLYETQELPARRFSVLLNADSNVHSFQFKIGDAAGTVRWRKKGVGEAVGRIRKLLQGFSADAQNPRRFPADQIAKDFDYADALKALAEEGSRVYKSLFLENWDLEAEFLAIRKERDLALQAVFCDADAEFPWDLLYDKTMPADLANAKVCSAARCDEEHVGENVICESGFWGVRHIVEQFVAFGRERIDRAASATWPKSAAVQISLGDGSAAASRLVSDLSSGLGGGVVQVRPSAAKAFLGTLWNARSRGAVTVVLGHVTRASAEAPARICILDGSPGVHMTASDLTDMTIQSGRWKPSSGVVLLLGCSSAAASDFELAPLHRAMLRAGAVAVVGTECDVYSDVAARFGIQLVLALGRDHLPMGRAVRSARLDLLGRKNPLAFLFSAYGDASLQYT